MKIKGINFWKLIFKLYIYWYVITMNNMKVTVKLMFKLGLSSLRVLLLSLGLAVDLITTSKMDVSSTPPAYLNGMRCLFIAMKYSLASFEVEVPKPEDRN
jgi:hypothetical protein